MKVELEDYIDDNINIFTSDKFQDTNNILQIQNIELVILEIRTVQDISTLKLIEKEFKHILILLTGEEYVLNILMIMGFSKHKFIKKPLRLAEIYTFIKKNWRKK